jgi:hypothetical protein
MSLPGFSGELALNQTKQPYATTAHSGRYDAILVPSMTQCEPCKLQGGKCMQTCYVYDPPVCTRGADGLPHCTAPISGPFPQSCDPDACLGPSRKCCPYGCVDCS